MRVPLRVRILVTMAVAVGAAVIPALIFLDPIVESREMLRAERELREIALAVSRKSDRGFDRAAIAEDVFTYTGARVSYFDARGFVRGAAGVESEASVRPPEVEAARMDGTGIRLRMSKRAGARRLYFALRTDDGAVIRVDRSLGQVEEARVSLRTNVLAIGFAALALAVFLGELIARGLSRSLGEVQGGLAALGEGRLTTRLRSDRKDELGDVARAFDRAAEGLARRIAETTDDEAQLAAILDAMVEGVFVTDPEGRIVLTNAALDRLAGPNQLGRTAVEAVRSAELHDAVTRALSGTPSRVQIETRFGIEPRILEAQVAPRRSGGAVVVLHDVTELKLADTVRRDFVANASHELRTPITAIRGFAETLRDGAMESPETAKRFLGRIVEHAVRLGRLVDDLLELSRAESPDVHFELESVDIEAACARILRGLEAQALEKQIALTMRPSPDVPYVLADEEALDHVLLNLVENAVKYTPDGGNVAIGLTQENGHVVLDVADDGPGIAAAHLPRVFERFYRVDAGRAREVGGTGLGLAIVKHLVVRMGGDVRVDSKLGKGTTFRVRLRAAQASSAGKVEAPGGALL